jgi:Xaa-Pro dipeptidase
MTMCHNPPFPPAEFEQRLAQVRWQMNARNLQALVVTKPENIYYLCGLDHQGFFAFHALVVGHDGPLSLVTREMEGVTIADQIPGVEFVGHRDGTDPAEVTASVLRERGHNRDRIGIETDSHACTPARYLTLLRNLPNAEWVYATWLVDALRLVNSPLEAAHLRAAAAGHFLQFLESNLHRRLAIPVAGRFRALSVGHLSTSSHCN